MPSTAKIKRDATPDLKALKTIVEIEGVPYTAFMTKCTLKAGEEPSYAEIECPLSGKEPDDTAEPPSKASGKWWFKQLKHGARCDLWVEDAGKKKLILTGTVQVIKHSVEQDLAQLTVVDDRQLMSGVPIRGCFVYDPDETTVAETAKRNNEFNDASAAFSKAEAEWKKNPSSGNSEAMSDARANMQTKQDAFAELGTRGAGGPASCVFYDEGKYPVFNQGGAPNKMYAPGYGPVFAPFAWWNSSMDENGKFAQSSSRASYWTLEDALTYLRNACYEAGTLRNLAQANFNDYAVVMKDLVNWPTGYYGNIQADVLNLGDDTAAARDQKDANRQGGAGDNKLPELSLRGLYVNQAISRIAKQAGAFDLYMSSYEEQAADALYGSFDFKTWKTTASAKGLLDYTPAQGGPTAEEFANNLDAFASAWEESGAGLFSQFITGMESLAADLSSQEQNLMGDFLNQFKVVSDGNSVFASEDDSGPSGRSNVTIVQTAPIGYLEGIKLWAAAENEVIGRQVIVEGVVERDSRACYTAVTVAGAPIMMETRLHFLPTAGMTLDPVTGEIDFYGEGSTEVDTDLPEACTLIPAWTREYRKILGSTAQTTQTAGEEYEFLDYCRTGGNNPDFANTVVGFDHACARYRRVFTAFKISNAFDWFPGTRFLDAEGRGLPQPKAIPPIPLAFLLTMLKEVLPELASMRSVRRVLPYKCTIEHAYQPATGSSLIWGASSILDSFDVDIQGVMYFDVLRDMSKQNTMNAAGSWLGHVSMPQLIRPKPLRVTIAFPLPFRLFESVSIPKTGTNYVNDATQYMSPSDPRGQGKYFSPEYARTRMIDVGDSLREYLRYNSYPTPQSAGGTKAPDAHTKDNELLSEREDAHFLAVRQLGSSSTVRKTGQITLNQLMLVTPGIEVEKIVDQSGNETECESVIKTVIHDFKRQMTTLELGSVL